MRLSRKLLSAAILFQNILMVATNESSEQTAI